jgi:hypothetical protein
MTKFVLILILTLKTEGFWIGKKTLASLADFAIWLRQEFVCHRRSKQQQQQYWF